MNSEKLIIGENKGTEGKLGKLQEDRVVTNSRRRGLLRAGSAWR